DEVDAEERREPTERSDLVLRHLAERAAVAAQAPAEDAEVLHGAAEDDADEDPERPGKIAELRGERRADQRPRPRDRGEVVAEDDPAVRRHEVAPVVDALRGCDPFRVEREHARGEERAVE